MASTSSYFYKNPQHVLDDIDIQLTLEPALLKDLTKAFLEEFNLGLGKYNEPMAMVTEINICCRPSFVTGVPDGTETGPEQLVISAGWIGSTFLALDLGGTNLRVCEVVLNGDKTFKLRQQKYKVSDQLKTGEASVLFDYLADSVDAFLTSHPPDSPGPILEASLDVLPLGLTFSFPVEQTALGAGKILTWTKGFAAKNAIGHDVVKLLQDAFDRKHMHVKCVALVNDTVGALLSRAYTSGGCILGAIFGTGTNGAYVEEVAKIKKLANSPAAAKGGYMIVNTEWGAFNNTVIMIQRTHLPTTPFDNVLDRTSINPRFQAFEKFISGMYLGEVTRNVLLSLIDAAPKPLLFKGKVTSVVNIQWGLDTSVMSEVEEAWELISGLEKTKASPDGSDESSEEKEAGENDAWDGDDRDILPRWEQLGSKEGLAKLNQKTRDKLERVRRVVVSRLAYEDDDVSLRDAAIVRWACHLVAHRAALLSGVAVATILIQTGRASFVDADGHSNGMNGSQKDAGQRINFYPHFERTMRESVRSIIGEEVERRVEIGLARDGSGVGVLIVLLVFLCHCTAVVLPYK
ncbi:hypothetical protein D9757_000352 [Collybiopsis confluens]|uniref:Phosphotransferase n=1 Tax=Collybiopsis confluens TaxID=2823264 RepID=A0A8H5I2X9_9AGAR|nr:hypothetical protein D9757_000352 [Collybiopsis confluens]